MYLECFLRLHKWYDFYLSVHNNYLIFYTKSLGSEIILSRKYWPIRANIRKNQFIAEYKTTKRVAPLLFLNTVLLLSLTIRSINIPRPAHFFIRLVPTHRFMLRTISYGLQFSTIRCKDEGYNNIIILSSATANHTYLTHLAVCAHHMSQYCRYNIMRFILLLLLFCATYKNVAHRADSTARR